MNCLYMGAARAVRHSLVETVWQRRENREQRYKRLSNGIAKARWFHLLHNTLPV